MAGVMYFVYQEPLRRRRERLHSLITPREGICEFVSFIDLPRDAGAIDSPPQLNSKLLTWKPYLSLYSPFRDMVGF